jgi:cell fate (sporulation/competence/biofilm development) regulator YlbF (YheA/YmcA/DUF963 family)
MLMEWILSAYDVSNEIKQKEVFKSLVQVQHQIQTMASDELFHFQTAKEQFELIKAHHDHYETVYKEAAASLSEAKKKLYESPYVQQYFETQHQVETILHQLLNEIAEAISPYIQTPTSGKKIGGSCGIY